MDGGMDGGGWFVLHRDECGWVLVWCPLVPEGPYGCRSLAPESRPLTLAWGSARLSDWFSVTSSGHWAGDSERVKGCLW